MNISSDEIFNLTTHVEAWRRNIAPNLRITPVALRHVEVLGDRGGATPTELARLFGVSTGSETVVINKLRAQELIELSDNKLDRRSKVVSLTEKGQTIYAKYTTWRKLFLETLQPEDFCRNSASD